MPRGKHRPSCEVDGCSRPHHAKGLCSTHYVLWTRTGSVEKTRVFNYDDGRPLREHLIEKFVAGIRKLQSGCWICESASMTGPNYFEVVIDHHSFGKVRGKVHRLSYERFTGPIPEGLDVCHKCDHPPCCNPDHLFVGTRSENMQDMLAKGRGVTGEDHPFSKLTDAAVIEIYRLREAGVKNIDIAERYSLHHGYVADLLGGRRRKQLFRQYGPREPAQM